MGHQINAIIGSDQTLLGLVVRLGSPKPTEIGLNLWALPLNEHRLDILAMSDEPSFDGFTYLSPALANAIAQELGEGSALYIETAYFGGMGDQGAALFENGELIWKKSESTFRSEKPKSLFARLIGARRLPPKSPISEVWVLSPRAAKTNSIAWVSVGSDRWKHSGLNMTTSYQPECPFPVDCCRFIRGGVERPEGVERGYIRSVPLHD